VTMLIKEVKGDKDRVLGRNEKQGVAATRSQLIVMYTTKFCPYCIRARGLLESKGWDYQDISVDADQGLRLEMIEKSGQHTVPQIWIGGQHVGGCDELFRLEFGNQLEAMVMGENQ
jgi:glutaredoxin 3